jgi:hypothetical protein
MRMRLLACVKSPSEAVARPPAKEQHPGLTQAPRQVGDPPEVPESLATRS